MKMKSCRSKTKGATIMAHVKSQIKIENARILFRNFSGEQGQYNQAGARNFCVIIPDELVDDLLVDGWNIRWLKPRDAEEKDKPYLQVKVAFDNIPPKIFLVTRLHPKEGDENQAKTKLTQLDEEMIKILDYAEIENVDLIIRPYNWNVSGKSGVKAYVKSMYVTIVQDDLESKYVDVPDSAIQCIGPDCPIRN